jgi:hypothetical protein
MRPKSLGYRQGAKRQPQCQGIERENRQLKNTVGKQDRITQKISRRIRDCR